MDTAQHTRTTSQQAAPPRHRVRLAGVGPWALLVTSVTWWVLDETGAGWPILATIATGMLVLKQVNDTWVARDLAAEQRPDLRVESGVS